MTKKTACQYFDLPAPAEFAQGELFEILEDDQSLPEEVVQCIAKQLVRALHYLHSNRIIHRYVLLGPAVHPCHCALQDQLYRHCLCTCHTFLYMHNRIHKW